ncbi:MAG: 3-hydroxyacyl-[acyl-carrier-protein] dehydratase FabZ [Coxiellaceae bacterium]|nr:3-hydroxyacyl-[acyl-carrier-protein] dehydratase FabZ [Coxiellaceae bacterium]
MITMDNDQVRHFLPHRDPFLFLDKVISLTEDAVVGIKNVSINEPFFRGHFPSKPIMPGVLIVESLAQLSGILTYHILGVTTPNPETDMFYFAGIDNARFKKMVRPGDQLRMEVELVRHRRKLFKFKGRALVDGNIVCEAEFLIINE